jgi:uncharacterized protein (DUF885 family)
LYQDPYQYFGMLGNHRAVRLVVDATHAKGWTRESYPVFFSNEAESEASIIPEIERYMAIPGHFVL